ncbi:MAG TPA: hypothetical protein VMT70_06470 [Vicinamibacteria bacterium]|nr:hypothetical protein [Vicinamibacteria bacterium]
MRTSLRVLRQPILAVAGLLLAPAVLAADPIAIHGVGSSSQQLANGHTRVHFTVRIDVFNSPLEFNYHWERSDGARSAVKTQYVKRGVTSVPVTTTWELGPNAPQEVWQTLFVNTGNTHVQSQPIRYRLH